MNVIEPRVRISCSLTCKYLIDGVGYLSTEKDRQNKLLVSYRMGQVYMDHLFGRIFDRYVHINLHRSYSCVQFRGHRLS